MNRLEQILKNTENIMQWLKESQTQGGLTVWIPVIAAIITATVALGGILYSTRYVKNNIRMNARIEWIQRVRETAAEAISLCYSLVYETDKERAQSILLKAQEKINLLILYFGPDEVKREVLEENNDILKNEVSNEGKNNYIVNFLKKVLKDSQKYYKRKYSCRVQMIIIDLRSLEKSYSMEETGERLIDEDGEFQYVKDYPKEYYEEKEKLVEEKNKLQNADEFLEDIQELRENLRIYLKVEWKVAKKGK